MMKKWIALAILCGGLCLTAPLAVLAGERGAIDDKSYQAKEIGGNAQGQKIIIEPCWEYDQMKKAYKLVKSRDTEGVAAYFTIKDGVLQIGRDPGYYYAFDSRGYMLTADQVIGGVRYYFTPEARAVRIDAAVTPNGTTLGMAMKNCWVRSDAGWYYFNNMGQQEKGKTGLQKINGSYYYLDRSSVPSMGKWIKRGNGAWWYFGKDGKYNSAKIGSQKINGSYYYLKKNGIPYKRSFKTVNKRKYYYGTTGKRAQYTGWKTINKKKYFFASRHYVIVRSGWQKINKKRYYFSRKGEMYTERWVTVSGKRYYLKADGQMAVGKTLIKGRYYYFKKSGELDRKKMFSPPSAEEQKATAKSYVNGSMDDLIAAIGAPSGESRVPSCMGPGEDVEYSYDGFVVCTYEENGVRTIMEVR